MLSIDRFEGKYAVCISENGERINIDISELPQGAKEGSIIKEYNNKYIIDNDETIKKRNKIKKMQNDLWE